MPKHTTYEFEEIEAVFPNGRKLYCSGVFNISYVIQPADPDVGIMSPYPEVDVDDDWVTVKAFDDDSLGEDNMTIRLPWLPALRPCPADPLGQIFNKIEDRVSEKVMEIEGDDFDE